MTICTECKEVLFGIVSKHASSRNPDDSAQSEKSFLINFIPAEQLGVIAKVPQEPVELPQGLGRAVEPPEIACPVCS